MAIQELKFRGISRTPSDRMTEDGGCAESLNFYIDNTENCPSLPPTRVVADDLPMDEEYEVLYIHKTPNYVNHICRHENSLGFWKNGEFCKFYPQGDDTMDADEKVINILSIGNTLVVMTSKRQFYVLFKVDSKSYMYLGERIPVPHVDFYGTPITNRMSEYTYNNTSGSKENIALIDNDITNPSDDYEHGTGTWFRGRRLYKSETEKYFNTGEDFTEETFKGERWSYSDYEPITPTVKDLVGQTWNEVNRIKSINHHNSILTEPVYVLFALRLYDGSVYAPSVPLLMGTGKDSIPSSDDWANMFKVTYNTLFETATASTAAKSLVAVKVELQYAYKIAYALERDIAQKLLGWEDLIESLDIFMTMPVSIEKSHTKVKVFGSTQKSYTAVERYEFGATLDPDSFGKELEERLASGSYPFYLFKSIPFDELASDNGGTLEGNMTGEWLATQESLDADFLSNHLLSARNGMVYNSIMNVWDVKETFSKGYNGVPSANATLVDAYAKEYQFFYHIVLDDGQVADVASNVISNVRKVIVMPYTMLFYPDNRCKYVTIASRNTVGTAEQTSWKYRRYEMKEHPSLGVSYAFLGMGVTFDEGNGKVVARPVLSEGSDTVTIKGKVLQSESSNPFLFKDKRVVTVSGADIVDLATTTKALSTGQFGSFPLYAFTKDGIYALSINDEGSIVASHPLSRDVALTSDMVIPIDQAIVFLTEKGVKILTGSDIMDISQYMNGRHWCIEEDSNEYDLINTSEWKVYLNTLADNKPFMDFMKKATGIYDYTGARLIFFNVEEKYQYIYKLDSQTWHKIQIPKADKLTFFRILNSYPDCITSAFKEGGFRIRGNEISQGIDKDKVNEILEKYGFMNVDVEGFINGEVELEDENMTLERARELEYELYEQFVSLELKEIRESWTLNWSTPLDGNDTTTEITSLLVSRPFTLGNDDVHKTINQLKSRGMFESKDSNGKPRVRYILLGSQDGIKFKHLGSLRGKSWKFYRIMVLTKLRPFERFTGTDVDFITKFTNKLR